MNEAQTSRLHYLYGVRNSLERRIRILTTGAVRPVYNMTINAEADNEKAFRVEVNEPAVLEFIRQRALGAARRELADIQIKIVQLGGSLV